FSLAAVECVAGLRGGTGALFVPLAIVAVLALRRVVKRRPDWRERSWRRFLVALAAAGGMLALLWLFDHTWSELASDLSLALLPLFLLVVPLQVLVAIELTEGVAKLTRWVMVPLRRRVSDRTLRQAAVPLLVAALVACGV